MVLVEVLDVLARDDVNLLVPVGVQVIKRRKLLLLTFGEVREVFEYSLHDDALP